MKKGYIQFGHNGFQIPIESMGTLQEFLDSPGSDFEAKNIKTFKVKVVGKENPYALYIKSLTCTPGTQNGKTFSFVAAEVLETFIDQLTYFIGESCEGYIKFD